MSEILFKGKRVDNGELVEGDFLQSDGQCFIIPSMGVCCVEEYQYAITSKFIQLYAYEIYPETVCQYTGLTDKNGKKIFEGDIARLTLPDGEVRYFKVANKSVVREVVNHPDFEDGTSKVEITGIVFEWGGYNLFPCTDTYGVPDYKMMEVVGNIFDNPDLLTTSSTDSD